MSFLNIKDPAERANLVKEYVAPMQKTLTDIDGALAAQHVDARPPPLSKTFVSTRIMGNYGWELKQ